MFRVALARAAWLGALWWRPQQDLERLVKPLHREGFRLAFGLGVFGKSLDEMVDVEDRHGRGQLREEVVLEPRHPIGDEDVGGGDALVEVAVFGHDALGEEVAQALT